MKIKNHYKQTLIQYAARLKTSSSIHFDIRTGKMLTPFEIDESRFELLNDYAKKKCYFVDQVCSIDYANYIYPQSFKKRTFYIY